MKIQTIFAVGILILSRVNSHGEEVGLLDDPTPEAPTSIPSMSLASFSEATHRKSFGEGFTAGTREVGGSLAGAFGMKIFGGRETHNLAFASLHYGWVFSDLVAKGHWYEGNWELLGEVFGGAHIMDALAM